jgi:multicomponent Na+:H+ antiporter subunit E
MRTTQPPAVTTGMRWGPAVALAALWILLTGADATSWVVGVPFIALSIFLLPGPSRIEPTSGRLVIKRLPAFAWLFIVESMRGGIDVSRRVLSRQPDLEPGFFDYRTRLQSATARQLFINCISLLPGTLCADLDGDVGRIHALDSDQQAVDGIRALETSVGHLFGETL